MAAAADADAPTAFKVAFSPNTTATRTAVTATLAGPDLDAAEAGKQVVSLKLQAPAGLKVDRKGVKAVCTAAEAAMKACPATSKGGSGTATFTAAGVGDVTAPITLYVTDPVQAGDPAGIQLLASALGQTFALVARVVPGASGPALVADGIDKALPLPITIKSLALTFAGKNVVQKTVIKKVKVRKTVNGRKRTVIVK
jgi:hypothetical protein